MFKSYSISRIHCVQQRAVSFSERSGKPSAPVPTILAKRQDKATSPNWVDFVAKIGQKRKWRLPFAMSGLPRKPNEADRLACPFRAQEATTDCCERISPDLSQRFDNIQCSFSNNRGLRRGRCSQISSAVTLLSGILGAACGLMFECPS